MAFDALLAEMKERDERDSTRAASPLRPAEDAVMLDSSDMTAEEVAQLIVDMARRRMEELS